MRHRLSPRARFWSTTAIEIGAAFLFVAGLGVVFALFQQL